MNLLAPSTLPPIPERVAAGALSLDLERPGWADRLDPEQVHVNPVTARISVVQALLDQGHTGSLHAMVVARGFILALADYGAPAGFPDADQVAAWRHEITRRQRRASGGGAGAPVWADDHEPLEVRVAADAALLDQRMPGWAGQIDTARLNSFELLGDTLGQLHGTFWGGLEALGLADDSADRGYAPDTIETLREMAAYWRREITRRQQQATEGERR